MKRLLPAILSFIIILGCISYLYLISKKSEPIEVNRSTVYVASSANTAKIYYKQDNLLYEYNDFVRGTKLTSRGIEVEVNDGAYIFTEVELDGELDTKGNPIVYYISSDNITDSIDAVVLPSIKYVRTPVTVYANNNDAQISSFLKKGTTLSICGYSGLKEDGSVEMYKIDNSGSEGYVYSKYLADNSDAANAVYTQTALNHAGREYSFELYGGKTENLDWYPVSKPELSSGPVLADAKTMYISAQAAHPDNIGQYIQLALDSGANAMVVDLKDGILTFESQIAAELSPTSSANAYLSAEQFSNTIQQIKNAGLYVIGRIVVFNDDYYAADHPEECIVTDVSAELWPSAYSRSCWYYNVALAQEAVSLFGFNEIQFDYVRFPETAYGMSESANTDFKNTYGEEKAEAIQNFCFYAADQMHKVGAYISVDVFGECVEEYVTAYGQYWPAISNVVDVISGMPYTDHYGSETDTWSHPYTTVYEWAIKAAVRQTEIRTPAIARTWITGYDTPNWSPTVTYGPEQLIDQAQALYDSGLTGGFIPWNGGSDLSKYYSYAEVWGHQFNK